MLGGLGALLGFGGAASAEVTISLIWQATGTNEIVDPLVSSSLVLDIVLNGGTTGSHGGGLTVEYGGSGKLTVTDFQSNPDGAFGQTLSTTVDTGTQVRNINGLSFQRVAIDSSVRLGSIVFHKEAVSSPTTLHLTALYTFTDGIDDGDPTLGSLDPDNFGTATLVNTVGNDSTCAILWPVATITTIGKGQSPSNNQKVSHAISGNIIDPNSLGQTAQQIPVCAGTPVRVVVTDTSGGATNSAGGSLTCNAAGCSGVVNVTEKYKSVSADGADTDRMTFLPQ
jgi:hypothetical protein